MRPAAICLRGALVHDKVYWFACPEEDKLMLKRLLNCLISLSSTQACADIFLARCRVVDRHGVGLLAFRPHYPVRHWSRYRINQNLLVDLRYDNFTSSVGVNGRTPLSVDVARDHYRPRCPANVG